MAQVSLPYTLTAGQPENVNQLQADLDALVAGVNTVNTAQIADGNVTTVKIADDAVTTAKILDANVTKAKLAASALEAFLQLDTNASRKIKWGSYSTGGFGGNNRASFNIAHGLGVTPQFWIAFANSIGAPDTSTSVEEAVIVSRTGQDSTNLSVRCSIANGATASVGTTIYWTAIA
jgi:hypothetical protein